MTATVCDTGTAQSISLYSVAPKPAEQCWVPREGRGKTLGFAWEEAAGGWVTVY